MTWLDKNQGALVYGLIQLAKHFLCQFCCIPATKEPAQPCNLLPCMVYLYFEVYVSPSHPSTPFVSTHVLLCLSNSSDFWQETLQATTSNYKCLKWYKMYSIGTFLKQISCVLTAFDKLKCLEFFKALYLETSNVLFGSFFQNPVSLVRVVMHTYG